MIFNVHLRVLHLGIKLRFYHHQDKRTMHNIKTFIFLDLETTGLPRDENNKTRITELCAIAVQSGHLALGVYPRVLNKLNLCLNPMKLIHPFVTELTGLANDILEHQTSFSEEVCETFLKFLSLHKKPVCFVAHNGNGFDYPIFKAEFYKSCATLPEDILCIDSLECFRELEGQNSNATLQNSTADATIASNGSKKNVPFDFCDNYDEILCSISDSLEDSFQEVKRKKIQHDNETTPKKPILFCDSRATESVSNSTNNVCSKPNPPVTFGVQKKLNFSKVSFKLSDVFKRLTKMEPDSAHEAESDVKMLIHCAANLGEAFVDWANQNAKPFSEVKMMVPGKKIGT